MARPTKYNWEDIQADYEAGMSQRDIIIKHGVGTGSISEKAKNWVVSEKASGVIAAMDRVSEIISEIKDENPALARKTIDIIQERHPEFKKAMINISAKLFKRINALSDEATAGDITSLAKGMQTITDTLGISQRHAKSVDVNVQNNISVIDPFKNDN